MLKMILAVVAILAATCAVQVWRAQGLMAAVGTPGTLVPAVDAQQVMQLIRDGKKVVFIDAREREEWAEERIPGAINISLREVGNLDPDTLDNPDLVIAYCLKDFRGFEVAKALRQSGVPNASILAELGINGWKKKGLPTVFTDPPPGAAVEGQLLACTAGAAACAEKSS